ncbi:lycopene cyclase domain-containing protein [Brachybacterium tyrofermentans]|uniref:lycopene cyclase domain-containing protein n=1 Tax=Brachybacterium tyrofermentans TaxID=47848 RepID=UPI003FCF292F
MAGLYLAALLVPSGCMVLLDRRFRLVLWSTPRSSARALVLTLGIGIVFFLLWDLAAIASGHYRTGQSPAMTGIELLPDLPLEELVFVSFLAYTTLVLRGLLARAMPRRRERRRRAA